MDAVLVQQRWATYYKHLWTYTWDTNINLKVVILILR